MVTRKCIGILYSYNSNWIGGSYYIQNLIQAIKSLPDEERPELKIICRRKDDFDSIREIFYPYAQVFTLQYSIPARILNRVTEVFFRKGFVDQYYLKGIEAIFPASLLLNFPPYFRKKIERQKSIKWISWIPDFQERYYPEFFDQADIQKRNAVYEGIARSTSSLILSSYAALKDFKKFYAAATCKVRVLHFAVTHPTLPLEKYAALKIKYKLPDSYFFVPNQFWKHKNHMIICKALKALKELGKEINVVFSGKEADYRNPGYVESVKDFIRTEGLTNQTRFLGFIPREDQLIIMKNADAVIQPSLFEGWSTVVEDAKALNVFLILSDISTHREQLHTNCSFFNPQNVDELVSTILDFEKAGDFPFENYKQSIDTFGKDFLQIVNEEISK